MDSTQILCHFNRKYLNTEGHSLCGTGGQNPSFPDPKAGQHGHIPRDQESGFCVLRMRHRTVAVNIGSLRMPLVLQSSNEL